MESEKYNIEKAREEALKMRQKIKSGEASNYADAEKLLEAQKKAEISDHVETKEKKEVNVYRIAQKKKGAVRNRDEIWVDSETEGLIMVYPSGEGAVKGFRFSIGANKDEIRDMLLSLPDSATSTVPFIPESTEDEEGVFFFLSLLREKDYDGIPTICFNEAGRVEIRGNTITILGHPDKIGRMIGKGGRKMKPFSEAALANGYRLVVQADPEIIAQEKKLKRETTVAQAIKDQATKEESARTAEIRQKQRLEYQKNELKNEIAYLKSFLRNKEFVLEVSKTLPSNLSNEFKQQGFYSQKDISKVIYEMEHGIFLRKAYEQDKEKQEKLRDQANALTAFRSLLNSNLENQKFDSVGDFTAIFELILESAEEKLRLSQQKLDELLRSEK